MDIGITYSNKKLIASADMDYVGECTNILSTNSEKLTIDPTTQLNAKIGYKLPCGLTISLLGKNLTDEKLWAPEFVRKKIGMLQNGSGRNISLELRKTFSL